MSEPRRKLAADAWGALLQVHAALVPTLESQVRAQTGLPLTWYDVLLELAGAPDGKLRMTVLAERVVLSRTRVSRLVDELSEVGLVCREENPHDRRSAYAVLTDTGRSRFRNAAPIYLAAIESSFAAGLSNEDLQDIKRALLRVRSHIDASPTPRSRR
ncbi:MAG: MarR family winged helix-turn-helix transcriptional regulator [Actinomycetota bacterium]|nr:MarR family winged helix-turn-helix transcriptional regulator [Actinomycetota bacterium]MDQ3627822.1 MarR family winged helix-turn-helix transcriptional regulator [Actinomycetota bacterium]